MKGVSGRQRSSKVVHGRRSLVAGETGAGKRVGHVERTLRVATQFTTAVDIPSLQPYTYKTYDTTYIQYAVKYGG